MVDKTPAEKKELIAKLLGIDSLEKAWKNLLPFINDYENQLAELKGKLYNSSELKEEHQKKKMNWMSLKKEVMNLKSK